MVAVFHLFFGDFLCPFYRDFMLDWYKTWDFGAEISWKPAGKNLNCCQFHRMKLLDFIEQAVHNHTDHDHTTMRWSDRELVHNL
jgi:hypothetical protein